MNKNGMILADSIAHLPDFIAFDKVVAKRFDAIQLDALLVYLIDTVDASLLPLLAEQFDVLGYKGLRLAMTEAEAREIIKRSIELKRYRGTLWAVREALNAVGYSDAVIEENVGGAPFTFRVHVDIGNHPINAVEITDVVRMIHEYKNTRSHLLDLTYQLNLGEDAIELQDEETNYQNEAVEDEVSVGGDFRHDGQYLRNGERNYNQDTDIITITFL